MLDILLRASVEGAVLVAVVWIVVRVLPGLSPSARAALWWCVAAKFVVAVVWTVPIDIAVLPPPPGGAPAAVTSATGVSGTETLSADRGTAMTAGDTRSGRGRGVSDTLLATWVAGLAASLFMLGRRWHRTLRVIRRASPAPPRTRAAVVQLARRLTLRRAPDVRISGDVDTPLVAGFRRPAVLLPDRFVTLTPPQQQMALCHELTHIKRGDLWIGCVPALAERLFFFHPLVHLAAREYVFWRESACDAAVLDTLGSAPHEYGRLLLDLGIAPPRPSLAAAGASWSFSNLQRRIHMLGNLPPAPDSRTSRFVAAAAVLLALCAAAPFRLVARAPGPTAALETPSRVSGEPSQSIGREPQPPAAPAAPAVPARPPEPPRQRTERDDAREPNYVLFLSGAGDERVHMSGSRRDVERARTFRRGTEPLLWFRDARGEFVVRDPSLLRQVEAIWGPVAQLGSQQGRLGAEQGALGSRMGEIGAKQGLIGAEQGRIGARQGAIGVRQAQLAGQEWNASDARRAEIEKARAEIDRDMRALDEEMKALDAKMREFERPMRDLSAEMEKLGDEMTKLGQEMERTAERAQAELRELLDRAVASGAAQAIK